MRTYQEHPVDPVTGLSKHILPLIPSGLLVQQVVPSADTVTITTAPKAPEACCPVCGHASRRVHSRYLRTLADLPWQGRAVLIRIEARRFRCAAAECPRRIFTERLPAIAAGPGRAGRRMSGGAPCHAGQRRHPAQAGPPD